MRSRIIRTGRYGGEPYDEVVIKLRDDGYRFYMSYVSGAPAAWRDPLNTEHVVAEYIPCEWAPFGLLLADLVMRVPHDDDKSERSAIDMVNLRKLNLDIVDRLLDVGGAMDKTAAKPTPVCGSCGYSARDHVVERDKVVPGYPRMRARLLWEPEGCCAAGPAGMSFFR